MAKKKSLFSELSARRGTGDNRFSTLNISRWAYGFQLFKAHIGKMIGVNFLLLIFASPMIYLFLNRMQIISESIGIAPFSANLGIGYMPYAQLVGLESSIVLAANNFFITYFAITALIFGIGLSGALHVIKKILWLEQVKVLSDFVKGIKKNLSVVALTFFYAVVVSVCIFGISFSDYSIAINGSNWLLSFSKVVCYIAIALFGLMYLNATVMSVSYKVKFFGLIKNSFLISVILIPLNVFILCICFIPIFLFTFGGIIASAALIVMFAFGISYFIFVWSNYSHWIYARFLHGEEVALDLEGEASVKNAESEVKEFSLAKKSSAVRIAVKPFDENDPDVRSLPIMFTLDDILEVEKSKLAMQKDSDDFALEFEKKVKKEEDAEKLDQAVSQKSTTKLAKGSTQKQNNSNASNKNKSKGKRK